MAEDAVATDKKCGRALWSIRAGGVRWTVQLHGLAANEHDTSMQDTTGERAHLQLTARAAERTGAAYRGRNAPVHGSASSKERAVDVVNGRLEVATEDAVCAVRRAHADHGRDALRNTLVPDPEHAALDALQQLRAAPAATAFTSARPFCANSPSLSAIVTASTAAAALCYFLDPPAVARVQHRQRRRVDRRERLRVRLLRPRAACVASPLDVALGDVSGVTDVVDSAVRGRRMHGGVCASKRQWRGVGMRGCGHCAGWDAREVEVKGAAAAARGGRGRATAARMCQGGRRERECFQPLTRHAYAGVRAIGERTPVGRRTV
ncbi:predicted protein [Postia placenta Mad-698-R]|uniref:Uncharacterized protein n=1 Tax=Postia placenta MAD-698-R-SB12 TaxID=670580 RepID=A0A1X6MLZ5_9APHY|nr:hypothetical protein POSPLADRAFT_1157302 [Postia placenta MAD-698-R-SB12]EED81006.1 predicted protein [Postia placenta Mad-698-R]OSX57236.1 hypothetical protein POSPLADRAFT_1157302 [Postia placenta MAD-698-R-SB12]